MLKTKMKATPTRSWRTYAGATTSMVLLSTALVAACGPVRAWTPFGAARPAVPAPLPPPAAPALSSSAAAAIAEAAANAPLRLEIAPGARDSALVVPALARPNLPPRDPWQSPDVTRTAFPARIERWRPLVRQVMAEEWQAGTLDGDAQRLDEDLLLAMMQQESQGNPRALSPVGAQGLMQVMPVTFALMMAGSASLVPAIDPDSFWDERSNIRAGIRYMALAMQNHEGNYYWSLASYNAGIGTAKLWRMAGLYAVPPIGGYRETANYTQIIMRTYRAQRPGLDLYVPPAMPEEHVAGAQELLRAYRR